MISAVDLWTFLHILLFVYWLGADLGVFLAAQAAKRSTLTYAQRAIALQLALKIDIAPRLSFALMFPCGLELAAARGLVEPAGWERALAWLTPGAVAGLAIGWLAVTAAATATARTASALAAAALLLLVVAVNVVPPNPYHAHWLAARQPGRLRDVAAASDWLAQSWPYALLAVLLWSLARPHPPRRPPQGL